MCRLTPDVGDRWSVKAKDRNFLEFNVRLKRYSATAGDFRSVITVSDPGVDLDQEPPSRSTISVLAQPAGNPNVQNASTSFHCGLKLPRNIGSRVEFYAAP